MPVKSAQPPSLLFKQVWKFQWSPQSSTHMATGFGWSCSKGCTEVPFLFPVIPPSGGCFPGASPNTLLLRVAVLASERRRARLRIPPPSPWQWPASAQRLVAIASAGRRGPLAQGRNQSEGAAGRCAPGWSLGCH